jgi:putative PIN family toxin of toxin-antitoxin system
VRVVLDTNTVVSALLWGGTPYALIAAATEERLELYSSSALLEEFAEVLDRAKFAPRLRQAQRSVAQLIEQYRGLVEPDKCCQPALPRAAFRGCGRGPRPGTSGCR